MSTSRKSEDLRSSQNGDSSARSARIHIAPPSYLWLALRKPFFCVQEFRYKYFSQNFSPNFLLFYSINFFFPREQILISSGGNKIFLPREKHRPRESVLRNVAKVKFFGVKLCLIHRDITTTITASSPLCPTSYITPVIRKEKIIFLPSLI